MSYKHTYPHSYRLVVASHHRPGQIVKRVMAAFTPLFLSRRLGHIVTRLRNVRRPTMEAADPVGPAQLANGFIALDIVQQMLKVEHRRGTWSAAVQSLSSVAPAPCQGEPSSTVWNPY